MKHHNLPIALESAYTLGVVSVQTKAKEAVLGGGPWHAPVGVLVDIDVIPNNATAAPLRARRAVAEN